MLYHSLRGLCTFKKIKYVRTSVGTNLLLQRGYFQNNSSGLKSDHNRYMWKVAIGFFRYLPTSDKNFRHGQEDISIVIVIAMK